MPSSISCYPYTQHHKRGGNRKAAAGGDMFCEGHNIFIDFDKVKGRHSKSKPSRGAQYLDFDPGSTFATCEKTDKWREGAFMPHASKQFRTFKAKSAAPSANAYKIEVWSAFLVP